MGKNDADDELNLLPGDLVESKISLKGDKGSVMRRGSKFKVAATDGAEAALVKPLVFNMLTTEIFMADHKQIKLLKTPNNIEVVKMEGINETGGTRKNRRRGIKGYFQKRDK